LSVCAGLVLVDAATSKVVHHAWLIATPARCSVSYGAHANAPAVAHRSNQVAAVRVVSAGHGSKV
jgi:hypothetical protein